MSDTIIAQVKSGSQLYGTARAGSDLDVKTIYIPDAAEILLGQASKIVRDNNEYDEETIPFHRFVGLLCEGQAMALEVIFAPDEAHIIEPAPAFIYLRDNCHRLLSKQITSMLTYAQGQVARYAIRGEHVLAAERAIQIVEEHVGLYGLNAKALSLEAAWKKAAADYELPYFEIVERVQPNGKTILHVGCCGRMAPVTASLKTALDTFKRLEKDYGQRTKAASKNTGGVDWKGIAHTKRILLQMHELLLTGKMVFPSVVAKDLLAIRDGLVPYEDVSNQLEALFDSVDDSVAASKLANEPDFAFARDIVIRVYGETVADLMAARKEIL